MNGNFEKNQTVYPVAYRKVQDGYILQDVARSIDVLPSTVLKIGDAEIVADALNRLHRSGEFKAALQHGKDEYATAIAEHAEGYIAQL